MKITRVTAIPVVVPVPIAAVNDPEFFHEPLNRGPTGGFDGEWVADMPFVIVKMESDDGPVGWGDTPRGKHNETLQEQMALYLGLSVDEITPALALTDNLGLRGIHTAALDWAARAREIPLHQLIGPQVRDSIPIDRWSGFRTPAGAAKIAKTAVADGYKGMKLKAGEITEAGATVEAIATACGKDFNVVIDPNGRWETVETTLPHARAMVLANPNAKLEDPIYGDNEALATVRRQTGITTIKTVMRAADMHDALEHDAADCFNLNGTWPDMIELAAEATTRKLPFWVGCSLQSGLDTLANIHFGVTQPMYNLGADFSANFLREHNLLAGEPTIAGGQAFCPDGPGLGIDVDQDAIERYRVSDPISVP
ncbi:MAG: mandelate racemase/muconate lactonizing enzyme family protein [Lentisphaeria bacterium]|nr:mandelate racemase/muconate lactonizing enzyme family protein [Lentisphaeria bacterium]